MGAAALPSKSVKNVELKKTFPMLFPGRDVCVWKKGSRRPHQSTDRKYRRGTRSNSKMVLLFSH